MKIGRSLGIGASVLAVIIMAAVIYVLSSLDAIVAGAIQKYGSQVTQTPVRVSSVSIDLASGVGTIEQLTVGNPQGFTAADILTLDGISTKLDVASAKNDPIVIEEINVSTPAVFYEINKHGASNIKALQKNIEQSTGGGGGGGGGASAESQESGGPRVVIQKLVIDGGRINARVAAMDDKRLSTDLPRIQMNNIGEKSGGATGAEVAEQVIRAIIAAVGPAVANLGLEQYVGKSLDEARTLLDDKVDQELGANAKECLKNLLDK